jgi:hypothetical protein
MERRERMRMRVLFACLGVATLGVFAAGASAAGSATTRELVVLPSGGPIEIFVRVGTGAAGTIVIAGAIGDYGKVLTVGANGKVNDNGHFVDVTLQKGTFKIDKTALDKASDDARPSVMSAATCSFGFSASGPITIMDGTGAYTGITGTLHVTLTFGGDGPFYATGPKKGKCNMSESAQPLAQFASAVGRGTITYVRTG